MIINNSVFKTSRFVFAQSPHFSSRVSKSNLDGAQEPEHVPEFSLRVLDKIKNNSLLAIILIFFIIFLLFQHAWDLNWDFSAYVINSRYLFGNGDYYEVYRPPLISLILGIFSIFGKFREYIYVMFAAALFFISTIFLSDTLFKKYWCKYEISKEKTRLIFTSLSYLLFNSDRNRTSRPIIS